MTDLTGKKIGRWLVLSASNPYQGRKRAWEGRKRAWVCKCDCGKEKLVREDSLKNGSSTGCFDCAQKRRFGSSYAEDLTGKKIGHWLVLSQSSRLKGKKMWSCRCDCGYEQSVRAESLKKRGENFSCIVCSRKRKFGLDLGGLKRLFREYKKSAEKRELTFDLSLDAFRKLTSSECYYCGCVPNKTIANAGCSLVYTYNGVDRMDNSRGYTPDNVVPCCKACNTMKSVLNVHSFVEHVRAIAAHTVAAFPWDGNKRKKAK